MKAWLFRIAVVAALAAMLGGAILLVALKSLSSDLPPVASIRELQLAVPLRVLSADGKLIGEFGAERRALMRFEELPPMLVNAFLAAEDDRFFEHPGIDWQGLLRAAFKLAASGEKSQGGSTITMQLARNVFLSNERTFTRKFKEMLLALRIEQELDKEQILELYLNKIFLGERAYGVGAAALVYFGKPAAELSLAECALIAGLPKAPSRDNPISSPERAKKRRDYVLRRMLALRLIDKAQFKTAETEPILIRPYQSKVEVDARYVAEMVRAEMVERYGDEAYTHGYTVVTTVDSAKQRTANIALRDALHAYDERHGWRGPEDHLDPGLLAPESRDALVQALSARVVVGDLEAAVVVSADKSELRLIGRGGEFVVSGEGLSWAQLKADALKPGDVVRVRRDAKTWRLAEIPQAQAAFVAIHPLDGAIEALVGGFDFFANKFNRVTQAQRQAGSGFKPFLYSAALAHGFTPASVFLDAPIVLDDPQLSSSWRPENYGGDLQGPMRMREALVQSRNLVSIRILQAIGLSHARQYIPRFGLPADRLPNNLTLALGSASFTPLEMARAYSTIANGGFLVDPYFISEIRDASGEVLFKAAPKRACPECPYVAEGAATGEDAEQVSSPVVAAPSDPVETDGSEPVMAPRVIDPTIIWLISDMMHDVTVRGTAARVNQLGRSDLAGKTGTTNDETDAWFSGFQKTLVAVAWVGFDSPAPLGRGEVGGRAALPIWMDFMRGSLADVPQARLPRPPGLVEVRIDPGSGKLARAGSPDAIFETVQEDRIPDSEAADDRRDVDRSTLEDLY